MNWKELSKNESEIIFESSIEEGKRIVPITDGDYFELSNLIHTAFKKTLYALALNMDELPNYSNKYKFDCLFGKKIYSIFSSGKYKIGEREASNDDIWRYIQVKIIPDILYCRWPDNVKPRMYFQSNRLYLKTLWWYYYLSFVDNIDFTCDMLLKPCNSSDTIVALVERSGKKGYRLDLYREIMNQKSNYNLGINEFRKLMVYNSAKLKSINPFLISEGIEGYVKMLINEVRGI